MFEEEKRYDHLKVDSSTTASIPEPVKYVAESQGGSSPGGGSVMDLIMQRKAPEPVFSKAQAEAPKVSETASPSPTTDNSVQPPSASSDAPPPTPKKHSKATARNSAKVWTSTLTMITSQVCSAISGQPSSNYKPSKEDQDEYNEVCAAYFEEAGDVLSPKAMFIIASLSFFGAMIAKSIGERRRKAESVRNQSNYKAAVRKREEAVESGNIEAIEEANEDLSREQTNAKRNIFQLTKDDYYTHDINGNHIKGPKPEKCTDPRILEIVNKHARGKLNERLKWGKINEKVRLMLYGHKEPVKNK